MDLIFDIVLRQETEDTARKVHELIKSGITPKAEYSKKCGRCSLLELCMPRTSGKSKSASRYLRNVIEECSKDGQSFYDCKVSFK